MSKILIVAEHANGKLNASTAKCLSAAKQMGASAIEVAVFAADPGAVAAQAAQLDGVTRVRTVANPANANAMAAVLAPQVVALAADYTHVLGPSTTYGKDLMPCVAALLGEAMVSDIMKVHGAHRFERPIYAGNAIITVECPAARKVVATVRNASFAAAGNGASAAPVEAASVSATLPTHTRYVELKAGASDRPDLQSAARVVSGGRAVGSADNFALIYKLADKLGAGVGASRAAVDAGYAPNDMQVGQTGKIIAPELYVAIGISGAIQHLTGIKDAGTIVAINKDGEAPIFEVADIGLVGDLFKIIPELEQAL
ncbi:MAG TPA: electron transfer flavoprotein subunit alpha/FixB family protein [Pseudomonadota bacterium]|nr:electron transfer flavoprotein subunit alpha/FixB family protein [Xanthomonadales bacterium]HQW64011.1 electron transfer flavoprotein subunit alpha/FixB family protein [Pseudomonadota bacterium]MBP6692730.1 electron transfer flavoprotein subunit alpha/FixB family protein [Xanthomonadales bacterium]MBP7419430.1 electron transfer flavoprotein subunit alpha/FixB family protein [Xanthomonadales bacterium]HQX24155.1 electron transfer flavoprotein subunit alpha/FixB family protein [Pseudomonadota 